MVEPMNMNMNTNGDMVEKNQSGVGSQAGRLFVKLAGIGMGSGEEKERKKRGEKN